MRPLSPHPVSLEVLAEMFGFSGAASPGDSASRCVTGVTMTSAEVQPGDLYVAVPGARFHGADFSADAVRRGAVAIVTDADGAERAGVTPIPLFVVPSPREIVGSLAASIYRTGRTEEGYPLTLGITGTNGKTSTVHLLDALLAQLEISVGLSSTAERRVGDEQVTSHLTTPEAPEVHGLLARMLEARVGAVIIEVSAHALTRHRIDGVSFDVVAFTNLSQDHLDDYASMDAYLGAKLQLFAADRAKRAVVSLDSPAGALVVAAAEVPVATIATASSPARADESTAPPSSADWIVTINEERPDHTGFTLTHHDHGSLTTRVPIIGRHMAANAGLAIAMLVEGGIPLDSLRSVLATDGGILVELPGRLVRVSPEDGPTVYVDSGHTPDAFAKTLEAIRVVTPGRVIMVTGADGGRDSSKRHEMGRQAMIGSDVVIVTDHHSRLEDPAAIRAALTRGALDANPSGDVREIPDPAEAIAMAINLARTGDTVLWSGMASQDYRDVDGREVPFSAIDIARSLAHSRVV